MNYIVMAKYGTATVLSERFKDETDAETMFATCLRSHQDGTEELDVLAWGRIVDDGERTRSKPTIDWFKWIEKHE